MILTLRRPVLRHAFMVAALMFSFQPMLADSDDSIPVLRLSGEAVSEDGHIKLEWDLTDESAEVEVQQAESENFAAFKTVYRGLDRATFISGLKNGTYYYRIRQAGGDWSEPVTLTVKHHSLRLAFTLFWLGAIVFVLTVFIVVKGARRGSVG